MQVRGGSGSGRQFMLVCRASSGSGLKTRGSGQVVIFRPAENSIFPILLARAVLHTNELILFMFS